MEPTGLSFASRTLQTELWNPDSPGCGWCLRSLLIRVTVVKMNLGIFPTLGLGVGLGFRGVISDRDNSLLAWVTLDSLLIPMMWDSKTTCTRPPVCSRNRGFHIWFTT